jgi:hypothetical protein
MSMDLPPPSPTPPSLEQAVQDHLDVIHEVCELRRDVGRMADAQTKDRLTMGGLEKRFMSVEKKLDALSMNIAKLIQHLGVAGA